MEEIDIKTIELSLKTQYINEDHELVKEVLKIVTRDDCRLLVIKSMQGTGKNEFLEEHFSKKAITYPSRLLRDQQHMKYGGSKQTGLEENYLGLGEEIKSTFASSITLKSSDNNIMVVDEAHKLLDYSNFAIDSVYSTVQVLTHFVQDRDKNKKVIMITATPEPLLEFFDNIETTFPPIDYYIVINSKQKRTYLKKLFVFPETEPIKFVNYIKDMQSSKKGKHIGLIDKTVNIEKINEELLKNNKNVLGISSKLLDKINGDPEVIKYFNSMSVTELLTHDILNATSLIDCGLNFNDT